MKGDNDHDPRLCPDCAAKAEHWAEKLGELINGAAADLEPVAVMALLVTAAGDVAGQANLPAGVFLAAVRDAVGEEWGLTISAVHLEGDASAFVGDEAAFGRTEGTA